MKITICSIVATLAAVTIILPLTSSVHAQDPKPTVPHFNKGV